MLKSPVIFEDTHGDAGFPAEIHHVSNRAPCGLVENFMYCHWHRHMEFIYITEGRAIFEIDAKRIEAHCGEALLINAGELHTAYTAGCVPCSLRAFVFDPVLLCFAYAGRCELGYIKPFVGGKNKMPSLLTGRLPWEAIVLDQIRQIISFFEWPKTGYELRIKLAVYTVLAELIENKAFESSQAAAPAWPDMRIERIKQTITHIEKNYTRKISVGELARSINLNTEYFHKLFKRITGMTPVGYMNLVRLRHAERLLRKTDLSVLEIAMNTGFDNVSYFIRVFKRTHQCTPREYRAAREADPLLTLPAHPVL